MGLPIDRLVIATNVNDILARTLATGTYELREVVRDLVAVDGHPGRRRISSACCSRPAAATPRRCARMMGSLAQSRRFALSAPRAVGDPRAVRRRPRRRGRDRRHHPHACCARPAISSIRIPPSASRSPKRKPRDPAMPMVVLVDRASGEVPGCGRGRLRRAAAACRTGSATCTSGRSGSRRCRSIRPRSNAIILAASRAAREGAAA